MDIRLIATDMDGTFLTGFSEGHPDNIEAVRLCGERGIRVCACTGRYWANSHGFIKRMGLDDMAVFCNGALVADIHTGEAVYSRKMQPEVLRRVLEFGREMKARMNVCDASGMYVYAPDGNIGFPRRPDQEFGFIKIYDNLDELVGASASTALKVFMGVDAGEHRHTVEEWIGNAGSAEITTSAPGYMEVMAAGTSKAEGLAILAAHYGIAQENVMAFGDNMNDMSMLEWAGVGVAMANGDDGLKRRADIIAPVNTEAGVARVIEEKVLGIQAHRREYG